MYWIIHRFLPDVSLKVLKSLFLLSKNQVTLCPVKIHFKNLFLLVKGIFKSAMKLLIILIFISHWILIVLFLIFFFELFRNTQHIIQVSITFLVLLLHRVYHRTEIKMLQNMNVRAFNCQLKLSQSVLIVFEDV